MTILEESLPARRVAKGAHYFSAAAINRPGAQICIDSAHEGSRQMVILDVANLVASFD